MIDGKAFSERLRKQIALQVTHLKQYHAVTPGLAVVLVGEDSASQVYVRSKGKQTVATGMHSYEHKLAAETSQADLLVLIERLNQNPDVHGILVQLPLPRHIDETAVINTVVAEKDVDGFHLSNVGKLSTGAAGIVPCTPLGSMMLLKDQLGDLTGMKAIVIGRSNIVGKPMAALLLQAGCTVTMAHSRTRNLPTECRAADIVVAAVGQPEMVQADWVKPGATVIDVGINRIENADGSTRLVGDVDFARVLEVAGAITPVPGGVGPMTIACLLHNTLQQACRLNGIEVPSV